MILPRLFSAKVKNNKFADRDYREELDEIRQNAQREKYQRTGLVGLAGGVIGGGIGKLLGKERALPTAAGTVLGAAGLGYSAYKSGKRREKEAERKVERMLEEYDSANPEERAYLRQALRNKLDRAVKERQARAQETIAWNTAWN